MKTVRKSGLEQRKERIREARSPKDISKMRANKLITTKGQRKTKVA